MPSSTGRPVSHERWRLSAQWAGVLAGPLMFLLLLQTEYVLSYVACETGSTWFLHLTSVLGAAIVAAAGFWGWRASTGDPFAPERPTLPNTDDTRRQRSQWMGAAALGTSALFVLLILSFEIPILVLRECQ